MFLSVIVKLFEILKSLLIPYQTCDAEIFRNLHVLLSHQPHTVSGTSVGSLEVPLWYGIARIRLHPDTPQHSCSLLWSHIFTLTTRDC